MPCSITSLSRLILYDCATDAAAVVIVTEWDAYRALDLTVLKERLAAPVIIDLRNIYRPEEMRRYGFRYISVGQPPVDPGDPSSQLAAE